MAEFKKFADQVENNWNKIKKSSILLISSVNKDSFYDLYLESYPEEVNQIFRERRHYDCNADRNFIVNIGRAVSIDPDTLEISTVWDGINTGDYYDDVAKVLSQKLKSSAVGTLFLASEEKYGSKPNIDNYDSDILWHHFYGKAKTTADINTKKGRYNTNVSSLKRSLEELTLESAETALSVDFYRKDELKGSLEDFISLKKEYLDVCDEKKELWLKVKAFTHTSIRNTAIGSLLIDLSEGKDVVAAITSFERKVAPENYKRPTAVITESMINKAEEKLTNLGYIDSIPRRCANSSDISVNDVLFADRSIQSAMKNSTVFDSLRDKVGGEVNLDAKNIPEVSYEEFLSKIKYISSMEAFFGGDKTGNLMTLVAPSNKQDGNRNTLTPWSNEFTWSYQGELTDSSLKEEVKKAGGKVDGDIRVSLGWSISDDYDLAVREGNSGSTISFQNPSSNLGGQLDVDANAYTISKNPVENICYKNKSKLPDGSYDVIVNNYRKRSSAPIDGGFTVEVEIKGESFKSYVYPKQLKNKESVHVCSIEVVNGNFSIVDKQIVAGNSTGDEMYGIKTGTFVPVNMVLNSPNHWEGDVNTGNKHTFFILEGCKTNESVRGFYNEFLKPELKDIRKVTEVLGSQMRAEPTGDQLSGLGFSHTQHSNLVLKVKTKQGKVEMVKVNF